VIANNSRTKFALICIFVINAKNANVSDTLNCTEPTTNHQHSVINAEQTVLPRKKT